MGSGCRRELCDKFIEEFNNDILSVLGISDNNTVIVEESLMTHDLYESVFHFVTIRNGDGLECQLMYPDVVFDPEANTVDAIDYVAQILDQDSAVIEKRFIKAGLV
jgi:hypothetical protein